MLNVKVAGENESAMQLQLEYVLFYFAAIEDCFFLASLVCSIYLAPCAL